MTCQNRNEIDLTEHVKELAETAGITFQEAKRMLLETLTKTMEHQEPTQPPHHHEPSLHRINKHWAQRDIR